MTHTISLITIRGTVLTAPAIASGHLVEFVVAADSGSEFLVRIPLTDLGAAVRPGVHVVASGAEGWVVPGRAWRDEPSRTIIQAHDVQLRELAFAA